VTVDAARAATGRGLSVADDLTVTAPPTASELAVLRQLEATKGAVA
jgi:glutaconate CoA-transferase, subunit B